MGHTYTALHYHIVFGTKGRVPSIQADTEKRLHEYIGGILRGEGCIALAIGGMPDHVHLLATIPATTRLADLLRVVKTNSSKWIRESVDGMQGFAWQAGYAAFTVSQSVLPQVVLYIRDQARHHATKSFEDEFVAFLKQDGIEYDERYVLG